MAFGQMIFCMSFMPENRKAKADHSSLQLQHPWILDRLACLLVIPFAPSFHVLKYILGSSPHILLFLTSILGKYAKALRMKQIMHWKVIAHVPPQT